MSAVAVFAVAALASFGLRSSMVLAGGTRLAGAWTERLPLVAPVMVSAIVANSLVVDHGQVTAPSFASLAAVGAAVVGVRRTGSLSASLAIGFPVFWMVSAVGLG